MELTLNQKHEIMFKALNNNLEVEDQVELAIKETEKICKEAQNELLGEIKQISYKDEINEKVISIKSIERLFNLKLNKD